MKEIGDNVVITGTLNAQGAVDIDSTLNVDGTANIEGATVVDDTLNVTGATDLDSTLNVDGAATFNVSATVKPGTAADTARVGGVLSVNTTQAGNILTGEDDLASFSVPANALAVNGQSIWFEAAGKCANNANAKTVRVRFGTAGVNLILEVAHITLNAVMHWVARGRIIRTGAATQKAYVVFTMFGEGLTGHGGETTVTTTLDQTLSGAVTLKVQGEATATNDIQIESFIVGWDGENS